MVFPYIVQIKFCHIQSDNGLIAWDKFNFFGESINDNQNRIEAVG